MLLVSKCSVLEAEKDVTQTTPTGLCSDPTHAGLGTYQCSTEILGLQEDQPHCRLLIVSSRSICLPNTMVGRATLMSVGSLAFAPWERIARPWLGVGPGANRQPSFMSLPYAPYKDIVQETSPVTNLGGPAGICPSSLLGFGPPFGKCPGRSGRNRGGSGSRTVGNTPALLRSTDRLRQEPPRAPSPQHNVITSNGLHLHQ